MNIQLRIQPEEVQTFLEVVSESKEVRVVGFDLMFDEYEVGRLKFEASGEWILEIAEAMGYGRHALDLIIAFTNACEELGA